jgi:hypothetical protein
MKATVWDSYQLNEKLKEEYKGIKLKKEKIMAA